MKQTKHHKRTAKTRITHNKRHVLHIIRAAYWLLVLLGIAFASSYAPLLLPKL